MCDVDEYLSQCCGAIHDSRFSYDSGMGICSKCKDHATFCDEEENKEYEDGDYYEDKADVAIENAIKEKRNIDE